jgi:hypothetical protein
MSDPTYRVLISTDLGGDPDEPPEVCQKTINRRRRIDRIQGLPFIARKPADSSRMVPARMVRRQVRIALVALGVLATALGAVGAALPVLPTTPFLILAAAAFLHSSPSLHSRLVGHPRIGPRLERFRHGIPVSVKVGSVGFAAAVLSTVAVFATDSLAVRIILGLVLAAKIVAMTLIPTARGPKSAAQLPTARPAHDRP